MVTGDFHGAVQKQLQHMHCNRIDFLTLVVLFEERSSWAFSSFFFLCADGKLFSSLEDMMTLPKVSAGPDIYKVDKVPPQSVVKVLLPAVGVSFPRLLSHMGVVIYLRKP